MLTLVFKLLNVKKDEESRVLLMLGHGFFMGIFFATFVTSSETLFLNTLGSESINRGIFTAGILGVVTTGLFAFLQTKISFGKLVMINLVVIFIVVIFLYYLLTNYAGTEFYNQIVFIVFAFNGPLVAVFLLGFWGVFGRMFDLRQSKRIIGGIDTGQLTAAIITSFVIGLNLLDRLADYFLFGGVSILISLIFLGIILKRFSLESTEVQKVQEPESKLKNLVKNDYVILLSVFLALSVTAFIFIERTYLTVLDANYQDKGDELLRFIAWFNGSILVFSFIFQTFFNDAIIANYGLKVSLLILPVVLSVFVVTTILLGIFVGADPTAPNFYLFFLSVAMSKLFVTFLRDAMENPAFKLYFMPLDSKIRFDIQAKIEGVVNETAKMIAGGFILVLGLFAFVDLISYYYILAFVIVGWIYITGKLYNEYRSKIKSKLESIEVAEDETESSVLAHIYQKLEAKLDQSRPERAVFSFRLMEKLNPTFVNEGINKMMRNPFEDVRDYAQDKMNEIRGVSVSDNYVIRIKPGQNSDGKTMVIGEDLKTLFETADVSKSRIARLCRSGKNADRQYAAELIGNSLNPDTLSYLIELLHDIDSKVRVAAIKSTEKRNNREVLSSLIDNFNESRYSNLATNSLIILGSKALEALDASFYKTGQTFVAMQKIIQVVGRIGGPKARLLLWNKIDYPDRVLASKVLVALGECGFRADFNQITRIKYAIESDIQDIAWNIAAYHEVESTTDGDILRNAIFQENVHDIGHIYTLLSMLYDKKSIALVRENINSGTSEGTTYAIELLDVFLSEDLKQKVIPILDDVADSERLKKLDFFYPRGSLSSKEVIKLLINRDFTQTNRWSKACALRMIGTMQIKEFTYDLIANMFNPDSLVCEMAAWSLYQLDPEDYKTNRTRLNENTRRRLDQVILPKKKHEIEGYRSLKYEKVLFLEDMMPFNQVPGLTLSMVVDEMEEIMLKKGETYSTSGANQNYFFIIYKGLVSYYRKGKVAFRIKQNNFIGELFEDLEAINSNLLKAEEDTVFWKIEKDKFYGLLSDDIVFAQKVIDQLKVA